MGDVAGFRLKEEEEIAVLLSLIVIGEETLLGIYGIIEMAGDFVLLNLCKQRPSK